MLSPQQTWVHAVDSRRALQQALEDETITAIETDLLMGSVVEESEIAQAVRVPIMAHPPNNQSDLSMTHFLEMVSSHTGTISSRSTPQENGISNSTAGSNNTVIRKVIKLDFKEPETVEPTLKAIVEAQLQTTDSSAILLNADILPGPGRRQEGIVTLEPSKFLETCLKYMQQSPARFALSLGFKTDFTHVEGYTAEDVQAMADIIRRYQLLENGSDDNDDSKTSVVLALNARLLEKSLSQFDSIMTQFPALQILVWTGKGEPSILQSLLGNIQDYYGALQMSHRIGYDCQVQKNFMVGASTEVLIASYAHTKSFIDALPGKLFCHYGQC